MSGDSGRLVGLMMMPTVICAGQQVGDADVVLDLFQPKWWGVGRLGGPDWHWAVRDG